MLIYARNKELLWKQYDYTLLKDQTVIYNDTTITNLEDWKNMKDRDMVQRDRYEYKNLRGPFHLHKKIFAYHPSDSQK